MTTRRQFLRALAVACVTVAAGMDLLLPEPVRGAKRFQIEVATNPWLTDNNCWFLDSIADPKPVPRGRAFGGTIVFPVGAVEDDPRVQIQRELRLQGMDVALVAIHSETWDLERTEVEFAVTGHLVGFEA